MPSHLRSTRGCHPLHMDECSRRLSTHARVGDLALTHGVCAPGVCPPTLDPGTDRAVVVPVLRTSRRRRRDDVPHTFRDDSETVPQDPQLLGGGVGRDGATTHSTSEARDNPYRCDDLVSRSRPGRRRLTVVPGTVVGTTGTGRVCVLVTADDFRPRPLREGLPGATTTTRPCPVRRPKTKTLTSRPRTYSETCRTYSRGPTLSGNPFRACPTGWRSPQDVTAV